MAVACNAALQNNSELCTLQTCCLDQAYVGYRPTVVGNSIYLSIFAVLFLVQVGLGVAFRTWSFMLLQGCGLAAEVLGYAGRILLYENPFLLGNFLFYIVPATFAPAFLSGALYLNLGRFVIVYGRAFSYFNPRTYAIVFATYDFIAILLQAAGGAITSSKPQTGLNILIAGLAFQVFSLTCFITAAAWFYRNVQRALHPRDPIFETLRATSRFRVHLWATAASTVLILVRCIYRLVELSGGFNSQIANNQTAFMVLEGPVIILAVLAVTVSHPGLAFAGRYSETDIAFTGRRAREKGDGEGALEAVGARKGGEKK